MASSAERLPVPCKDNAAQTGLFYIKLYFLCILRLHCRGGFSPQPRTQFGRRLLRTQTGRTDDKLFSCTLEQHRGSSGSPKLHSPAARPVCPRRRVRVGRKGSASNARHLAPVKARGAGRQYFPGCMSSAKDACLIRAVIKDGRGQTKPTIPADVGPHNTWYDKNFVDDQALTETCKD